MSEWLERSLQESQELGFLGPGALDTHMEHSLGFARAWESVRSSTPSGFIDLGTGGGIPGLVLAEFWQSPARLVDSMVRRTRFLEEVATAADAPPGITVTCARAEDLSRTAGWEGTADLVTARAFGPPAVVAECAARFLAPQGVLIVSEPPPSDDPEVRWPAPRLTVLGLEPVGRVTTPFSYQVLIRTGTVGRPYPRPSGTPAKRALF